ncbi:MAG: sigma-54-dependent Fis family transcriptional regulator [Proteobacteria bacterium]|nr:sigma-54-dependent Fis family transcriptional regulator [Pseudomonadota bacterium]
MTFTVLVVEDDSALREAICDTLQIVGYATLSADNGHTALRLLQENEIDIVISDVQMGRLDGMQLLSKIRQSNPEIPVLLMTAYGTIQQAVESMQEGAVDYLVKPFESEVVVTKISQFLPTKIASVEGMVAVDEKSKEIVQFAQKVSQTHATVMITGDSGTGKEILVRFIHQQSARKDKPFVAINCAAIPDNMLEAILFGYQKGAFTGAYKSCPGKFEQAQGGTLLLDEISEMSLRLQAKLLRVLQEREVERLGDQKLIQLDVRIMATSNRDMVKEVKEGRFREDLYYRLNVIRINMPALRERPDDIVPIAEYLLAEAAKNNQRITPKFSDDAIKSLKSYSWPGNVRELDNMMQRTLIMQAGDIITAGDLQFEALHCLSDTEVDEQDGLVSESLGGDLKVQEKHMILNALQQSAGSRKTAAEQLGISPRTLRYKIARMREDGVAIPTAS